MEREVDKLRERIEARRLAVDAQPATTVGLWFAGAGLSFASGFMAGVSRSIPPQLDRDAFLRLLMRATAAAMSAGAAFVDTHSPDAVPSSADAEAPAGSAPAVEPDDAGGEPASPVTRADLIQRLRRQSAGAGRTGSPG